MAEPRVKDEDDEIASLLDRCLATTDPRAALDELAAGRPDLAARARRILERVLDAEPCTPSITGPSATVGTSTTLGPFRVLGRLGVGGMGAVFLAEQSSPVRRLAALKVIKPGLDTEAVLARFSIEMQALALMDHPHIAKVYEAGRTADGRPWFAMEYVDGVAITRYCDEHRLPIPDRLGLFAQVCGAVQHAHSKGVIHRDLTANNVLVRQQDGKAVVKVVDFGLARAADRRQLTETLLTQVGVILGTPEYMSPEQAGLAGLDVDMRTDVYALGVLLYELLTGTLPFASAELRQHGYEAMCRVIREREPERPSSKLLHAPTAGVSERRRTELRGLLAALRGDLDWIVLKCMEKDRERRYATVSELGADVQRYLDHEPVLARAPSIGYRLRKLLRRHRAHVVAASALLVALLAGITSTAYFAWRAHRRGEQFDQLAVAVRLNQVHAAAAELFPAWPERTADLTRFIDGELRELLDARQPLVAALAALRQQCNGEPTALPPSERFLFTTLSGLQGQLDTLAERDAPELRSRLQFSRCIGELTLAHPNARATWAAAREALARADGVDAHVAYSGRIPELAPQTGLVPIGMNPATKLWEFYDLRSAWDPRTGADPASLTIPCHDEHGHIAVGEATGMVFVLLPGGDFTMGAQSRDEAAPNHDPDARQNEVVHSATLAPFFIARHELTQGQWQRLTGESPSGYAAGEPVGTQRVTLANPVEQVTWRQTDLWLRRIGCQLPTEAQWEYACRAHSTTPWSTGPTRESLRGAANIADRAAKRANAPWREVDEWPEYDDGHGTHAPVDAMTPNAFGLHHVHGNVFEWCLDNYGERPDPPRSGDGLREAPDNAYRVSRGGSYASGTREVRSAFRSMLSPDQHGRLQGVRAARALAPGR